MKSLFDMPKVDKLPKTLIESFVVPPFSTLDTRQGYWIDRKRMWEKYLGDTGATRDGDFGRTYNIQKQGLYKQTSMFDPVLVELMYKWFCPDEGKILDPFGGEQTKGIVAGLMGYKYLGIELRQEQVDINNEQSKQYKDVEYICDDSRFICQRLPVNKLYDFCLTSPPYFNLEEYSTKKEDLSKASYEKFFDGLFIVRAAGNMKSRKIVKCHQNVLVFYKGDMKKIKDKFPELR